MGVILNNSKNNNISTIKHISVLDKKFHHELPTKTIMDIEFLNLDNVFFYKKVSKRDWEKTLLKFSFFEKECMIFDGNIVGEILDQINLVVPERLTVKNSVELESLFKGKIKLSKNLIRYDNKGEKDLFLDTSILNVFILNKKTSNKFSSLVIDKDYNFFFLHRKDFFAICAIAL